MNREIEYVYRIYRCGSFSKAAQQLFISQPALSAAVKKLEQELGTPLFDRKRTPVKLTQAGEFYVRSAEKILDIQADIQRYFSNLNGQLSKIELGSSSFFCAHVLPRLVLQFQSEYPFYSVELSEANASVLAEQLEVGRLDFALTAEFLSTDQIQSIVFEEERIVLAVPAHFPINERLYEYRLSFEDIRSGRYLDDRFFPVDLNLFQDEPFLLLKQGNELYQRALDMCAEKNFFPKIGMLLDQVLTAYYIACDGAGVTFLRDAMLPYVAPTDRLYFYKLDTALCVRNLYLSFNKNNARSAVRDFLQFLKQKKSMNDK